MHAHDYTISLDTFNRYPKLANEFKIIQVDKHVNFAGEETEFINAMEHIKYPIFSTMYHPEYQLMDFAGPKKWHTVDNEITDEIAFRVSLLVNRYSRKNSNKVLPAYQNLIL